MPRLLQHIVQYLNQFAPLNLAASWDNVGLLLGDEQQEINRVMTCLTLTSDVAKEAIEKRAELIVSHHPVMFRPVQKLTSATVEGRVLLPLLRNGVAVYSPHTAFDSTRSGINELLSEKLGLREIRPLTQSPHPELSGMGVGRCGHLPQTMLLSEFLAHVKARLAPANCQLQFSGDPQSRVNTVGIGCGSAGDLLSDAIAAECDVFLTGEARFHTFLEAREKEISLVVAGHYLTERHGIELLGSILQAEFPELACWASEVEVDPVQWSVG